MFDNDESDTDELIRQRGAYRRYKAQLYAHPDPRDPDHPEDEDETEADTPD